MDAAAAPAPAPAFPPLFSLAGRVALITGAAEGIGLATARLFAQAGALVQLVDRNPAVDERAERLRGEGLRAEAIHCDVTDAVSLERAVGGVLSTHGRIDGVVCNAGADVRAERPAEARQALDLMLELHLHSAMTLADAVLPQMARRGEGSFTVVSSIAGLRGNRVLGLYAITKAANAQLARDLAVRWGPSGLRVNAVSPGVIDTEFAAGLTGDPAFSAARLARTPLRRFGRAEEVAATLLWLATPGGAFTTGQNIVVDGGTLISD